MLVDSFTKSFSNLLLPGIIKIFFLCLLLYFIGWAGLAWLMTSIFNSAIGTSGAESWLMHALGSIGGMMIAWLMFPLLYPILMGFFDEQMAEIIETQDYPHLPKASPPFWPTLRQDAWFSVKAILLNILCLPLYFVPLVGLVVYYTMNGYLLGSQFFRMAAGRRVSLAQAMELRRRARGSIILGGAAVMFCATIPLLNLIAPLLGVATMLHLFHAMNGANKVELLPPQ